MQLVKVGVLVNHGICSFTSLLESVPAPYSYIPAAIIKMQFNITV